jgi:hypothetical protein
MILQALPRFPQSSRAACRARWISSRDTIEKAPPDPSAKAPQVVA